MRPGPPGIEVSLNDLPTDPSERHEALVDIFGRSVMWMRDLSLDTTRQLGESEPAREGTHTLGREKWDKLSNLSPEQRAVAYEVAEASTDRFVRLLLAMLGNQGVDQRLGNDHAVRFKLDLEICELETLDVIESETINRGGRKFFSEYWGRWLNKLRG